MFNDIQLCSRNSSSIVAHTWNSSCFKFVKSIFNHSFFSFSSGSVFQCRKLLGFLKYMYLFINQYLVTWKEICFLYFSIIQFKFVFSYPQCILCLKIIRKTWQFIYCFNSSLLAVAVMVIYIQFIYGIDFILVWTFADVQFVVNSIKILLHILRYKYTLCDHWSEGFGSWGTKHMGSGLWLNDSYYGKPTTTHQ